MIVKKNQFVKIERKPIVKKVSIVKNQFVKKKKRINC